MYQFFIVGGVRILLSLIMLGIGKLTHASLQRLSDGDASDCGRQTDYLLLSHLFNTTQNEVS